MSGPSLVQELRDFVTFAKHRIESGAGGESVEGLLRDWRSDTDFSETISDVRRGLRDKAAGLSEPVDKVFADIRRQLGLPE
jgi:hypothetical protein